MFALLWIGTSAQEHQFLNKRETIVENGVYKMIQYDALDSLTFMDEFSNGYYSIYNEEGEKVKSNSYRSHIDKNGAAIHEEYINYYIYDSLGEQIGMIQMFPELDEPFNIISLKSISEDRKTVRIASLESDFDGDEFIFKEYPYSRPIKGIGDTINIDGSHYRAYGVLDSALYLDLFYAENGSIDSTIFHSKCNGTIRGMKCSTKTIFSYSSNGAILGKFITYRTSTSEVNPYLTKEVRYMENGLIDSIETNYLNSSIDETTLFRFEYKFRED